MKAIRVREFGGPEVMASALKKNDPPCSRKMTQRYECSQEMTQLTSRKVHVPWGSDCGDPGRRLECGLSGKHIRPQLLLRQSRRSETPGTCQPPC